MTSKHWIILILVLAGLTGGFFYWRNRKKSGFRILDTPKNLLTVAFGNDKATLEFISEYDVVEHSNGINFLNVDTVTKTVQVLHEASGKTALINYEKRKVFKQQL